MKQQPDQRQFSRSKVSVAATLTPEGSAAFGVEIADLSMGGMFIHADQRLQAGSKCRVTMLLGHINHELPIIADAIVVRSVADGIALRFESVRLESIDNMQQLIIEHADDPEQTRMEFSSGGGWAFSPE